MYPNLLNLFFKVPPWTLSRVCTVVSLAVGTDSIFCACLTIMVWKTTAGTDRFATTYVLSIPKPLTFGMKGSTKVRIKVFVGNSSLFRRTFILLTDVTPCEDKCSQIFSSLTPSNSGAGRRSEVERSLMVRWVIGSILHGVDPLSWCSKGRGVCYPVCGMVHIKEPLLLIGKSSLCGGSGFPFSLSEWSLIICLTPYNRR